MKNATNAITVTIRALSSDRKLCAMLMDDLGHAHSIAKTLVESPNYARCYMVATDWQGNVLFQLRPPAPCVPPPVPMPQQAYYPPPMPQYAHMHHYPSAPPPAPPAFPQYQQQSPPRAYVDGQEVECQIIPFPALPARR